MATPAPIRQPQVDPFERQFTPKELAELWRLDESTIRRLFFGTWQEQSSKARLR